MTDLLAACDLMESAGHTHVPVAIKEIRSMAARIGKAKITETKTGRKEVVPARKRRSVSKVIGSEKSASRKAKAWSKAAKGRATVKRVKA